ncbi:MAG: transglutaminase domain-containing protein [Clostridia bacterium]|nr:transglutaminase domain-containing protein [Clostridia bacterium]
MKKRIISLLIVVSLLAALSGCSSMFKKEYLSVSEYKDDQQNLLSSNTTQISNFIELKAAIIAMVSGHKAEGRLRFTAYDGTIQDDLSRALLEAKSENALASFAVDYMSYDLSPIVTYYEAVVYITYKKTQSEIDDIRYITGKAELADAIEPVLEEMSSYVALRLTSATVTEEDVISAVNFAYTQNPVSCVVPPSVTVTIHPESGLQRIIELDFEYGWKSSELEKMRAALNTKIQEIVRSASNVKDAEYAYNLYQQLALSCTYDPTGAVRSGAELDSGLGSSAYGALLEYCADSRGFAAAYSALCRAAGIECLVVDGTMDNEAHSWNIIRIEGNYFHVDATAYYSLGAENSFMRSDEQFKDSYIWDAKKYPACAIGEPDSGIISNTF